MFIVFKAVLHAWKLYSKKKKLYDVKAVSLFVDLFA